MLLFESFNEIEVLCQKYDIRNYTINKDGTIDVDGSVYLEHPEKRLFGLTELPLKFREVTGDFYCSLQNLTTLEGAPQLVGCNFYCYENKLTTLKGAPHSVGGYFSGYGNDLTTLEGAPQSVVAFFHCGDNKLTTLEGAPQSLGGGFYCNDNPLDPIRKLFPSDTTFYKLCMEWQFFAGGNKIYKHRFLEAMLDIGKKRVPRLIPGYEYI